MNERMKKNKELFLSEYYSALNNNNADYFVYGEYKMLPKDTNGSDIDMIIFCGEDKFPKHIKILLEVAKKQNIKLVSAYYSKTSFFLRFLSKDGWGVQFDILRNMHWHDGKNYYPIEYIKKDVILHNNIKVLDIKVGYYLDYLKETSHVLRVKEKYANGFIEEYLNNKNRKIELEKLYGKKFTELIDSNLSVCELCKIAPNVGFFIRKTIHKNDYIQRFLIKFSNIKRFMTPPGYVIAILGTDGSGKSTIINNITPILNEGFHNGVIYNHLRPNVIPDLGVVMGKKEKTKEVKTVSNPHSEKQSGFVGSLVRWGYYMIDYTFGYLKAVYPVIHTKSKVFIFDRYYYDYYIDQKRSKTNLPNWVLKFGEFFVPKPDIILCLGGDPEKIYNRKPETSLEEVTRQTNALKEFCSNHKNAVWIDTCTDIQTSTDETMNAICDMMAKRFSNFKFK